jgi:hypothetical protein
MRTGQPLELLRVLGSGTLHGWSGVVGVEAKGIRLLSDRGPRCVRPRFAQSAAAVVVVFALAFVVPAGAGATGVFVSDSGSSSLSVFGIGLGGVLSPLVCDPATVCKTGVTPMGLAIDPSASHLYVADDTTGSVSVFSIGAGGVLTPVAGRSSNVQGSGQTHVPGRGDRAHRLDRGKPMTGAEASATTHELLEDVRAFVRRFVVLPTDAAATVLALFVLHTWAIEAAEATAYMVVVSAEKGSILRTANPELPDELSDRAADGWEPLLAIADLAGEEWATEARQAAAILSAQGDEDELALGPLLLAGIRRAMDGRQAISTADLLASINADEELPFGAWNEGRGVEARRLARLLKPYGIKPKSIRMGDGTPKGYALEDLHDAFARYLPEPQQAQQAQRAEPPSPHRTGDVADVADVADMSSMEASGVEEELASEDLERDLERLRAEFDFDGNLST